VVTEADIGEQRVGVRELKARLSEYLRQVKQGHTLVITERGKAVGRLIPQGQSLDERLEELQRAGLIRWNGKKLSPMKPIAKLRGKKTIADIIIEDRR
jgi:prevent-host-death family protein